MGIAKTLLCLRGMGLNSVNNATLDHYHALPKSGSLGTTFFIIDSFGFRNSATVNGLNYFFFNSDGMIFVERQAL